jgi:hypothetical protein
MESEIVSKYGVAVSEEAGQLTLNLKISQAPEPRKRILDFVEHLA